MSSVVAGTRNWCPAERAATPPGARSRRNSTVVDFTLTDEQKSMREMAHEFAEKEIRPVAWEYDRDGTWPGDILQKAWELGLMNNHLPSEYGGPGLGFLDGAIIEEEIAWGCSGIGTSLSCNGLATAPVILAASEELKKEYLGRLSEEPLFASFTFPEVEIPLDHLVGEENKGFKIAMMTLDRTRPGVAAMAVGVARAAMEFAIDYSKERVQFGVPIAMHQAIQFIIADMATKVHLSRLATWNSAVLLDQGKRNTLESSHAKRFAADTAMEVTTDAVQVYGGYGFIKEYPVEKLMRDAKILQLYEGTAQIQRLVIARETLLPRRVEERAPAHA